MCSDSTINQTSAPLLLRVATAIIVPLRIILNEALRPRVPSIAI